MQIVFRKPPNWITGASSLVLSVVSSAPNVDTARWPGASGTWNVEHGTWNVSQLRMRVIPHQDLNGGSVPSDQSSIIDDSSCFI